MENLKFSLIVTISLSQFRSSSSLSLEYNPKELQNLSQINPENIPKIQYLQCPAGVQIRHLEKFLCSKFSITSQDHSVELIYQDSVVSKTFTLMDVVYCFDWKKVSQSCLFDLNLCPWSP